MCHEGVGRRGGVGTGNAEADTEGAARVVPAEKGDRVCAGRGGVHVDGDVLRREIKSEGRGRETEVATSSEKQNAKHLDFVRKRDWGK